MDYTKKIQELIDSLGFTTNKAFAEAMGMSPARVSNYINGRSMPDFEFFQILKEKFPNTDIDLLFVEGQMEKPVSQNQTKIKSLEDELREIRTALDYIVMKISQPTSQMTAR